MLLNLYNIFKWHLSVVGKKETPCNWQVSRTYGVFGELTVKV